MWFTAKCIFRHQALSKDDLINTYEERIIIIESESFDWAIVKAENEAKKYAAIEKKCEYINFIDCYKLGKNDFKDKSEIYSLMRSSSLDPDEYISRYYHDGTESSQKHISFEHDMDADLIAVGNFSEDISDYLEYDKKFYKNAKQGCDIIISSIFYVSGEARCKLLSECLCIDYLDINQHAIKLEKINIFKLKTEFDEEEVKKFLRLTAAGFRFYFMMYFNDNGADYFSD